MTEEIFEISDKKYSIFVDFADSTLYVAWKIKLGGHAVRWGKTFRRDTPGSYFELKPEFESSGALRDRARREAQTWCRAYTANLQRIKEASVSEIPANIQESPFDIRDGNYIIRIVSCAKTHISWRTFREVPGKNPGNDPDEKALSVLWGINRERVGFQTDPDSPLESVEEFFQRFLLKANKIVKDDLEEREGKDTVALKALIAAASRET